ncbi:MAG: metallophosphoesterase [Pseudomonadota bacterium]
MRFAHFTDLHLPIRARPRVTALLSKRVLGYQSWLRKRHKRHQQWTLDTLVADAKAKGIDGVLVTGDITNIALPSEFRDAATWMAEQLTGLPTAFVPGNHDSYVDLPWADGLGLLDPFMEGWSNLDEAETAAPRARTGADDFPFIAPIGLAQGICCICANSCPPTAPGMASGRLGDAQIAALAAILDAAKARGLYRLVLVHHPVSDGVVSWRKALHDAPAFQAMIAAHGADLILHGHTHFPVHASLTGPDGPVPVLGGGSASHTAGHGKYTPARYSLLDIARGDDGRWQTDVTIQELDVARKSVHPAREQPWTKAAV